MGTELSQCPVAGGRQGSPRKSSSHSRSCSRGILQSDAGQGKRLELRMWEPVEGGRGGCHSPVG